MLRRRPSQRLMQGSCGIDTRLLAVLPEPGVHRGWAIVKHRPVDECFRGDAVFTAFLGERHRRALSPGSATYSSRSRGLSIVAPPFGSRILELKVLCWVRRSERDSRMMERLSAFCFLLSAVCCRSSLAQSR